MLGKVKLEYAAQEPQWAHVVLDITPHGFSTGLLKHKNAYFEIEADLIASEIIVKTKEKDKVIKLTDGKAISDYYKEIIQATKKSWS
ncbi:DUF5996 family protein [Jeotgalibaca dankookensis]|uniref:DUF5996 family protein n=1 Tax=Jeotgalibaca dankookensis TaxID=708126 RepID=UPI00227719BF|nr:DUF5996 family protein [Jeotgalibaca dankookensis]